MKKFTFFWFVVLVGLNSCDSEAEKATTRTYKMGFQNSAPRFDDFDLFLAALNIWTPRADAAMITTEVPWDELLAGTSTVDFVVNNYKGLVEYYRQKNFELWVYIDPQNGLDRTSDAVDLVAAGRSITEPEIQQIYRRFAFVMDSVLKPEHLGLALETNLIRSASSPEMYNAIVTAANQSAIEIRAVNPTVKLSISIQVDHAWGKLGNGPYAGIEQDFTDFPFMDELGLSSYPYFGFDDPNDIPVNYYSKLIEGKSIPVFISEGGWTSESVTTPERSFVSSTALQQKFLERQALLLDKVKATAWLNLVFSDIDLANLPGDVPDNIGYFAYLGFVDLELEPKPSLTTWDKIFARKLVP